MAGVLSKSLGDRGFSLLQENGQFIVMDDATLNSQMRALANTRSVTICLVGGRSTSAQVFLVYAIGLKKRNGAVQMRRAPDPYKHPTIGSQLTPVPTKVNGTLVDRGPEDLDDYDEWLKFPEDLTHHLAISFLARWSHYSEQVRIKETVDALQAAHQNFQAGGAGPAAVPPAVPPAGPVTVNLDQLNALMVTMLERQGEALTAALAAQPTSAAAKAGHPSLRRTQHASYDDWNVDVTALAVHRVTYATWLAAVRNAHSDLGAPIEAREYRKMVEQMCATMARQDYMNSVVDLGNQAAEFQHALDIARLWQSAYGNEARFRKLLAKLESRYDASQTFFGPENMKIVYADVKRDEEKAKTEYKASGKKTDKSKGPCYHCGRTGHIEAKCWDLHPELKPRRK